MSGICHVRARPLKPAQHTAAADEPAPPTSAAPGTATTAAGNTSSQSGGIGAAGGPVYSSVGSHSSVRRTTWEGAAFTPQEQAKLEAVKAALDADKQKHLHHNKPAQAAAAGSSHHQGTKAVEKDAMYWTAKYMHDAATSATGSEPQWGLEGGLTPLAAVFAAKWRQQVRVADSSV
eukprot:GHUV01028035.1.p1 GENE.GHUV01028035.1~~GHUV01028035.1.p1  ORF type:complete len:176 (+),score=67.14 GHUV01028035.1:514-1041(+)